MERADSNRIPTLILSRRRNGRSVYSDEGKRAIVAACLQPGVSVSGIAYDHGVNANLVRKWMRAYGPEIDSTPGVAAPIPTLLSVVTLPEPVPEKLVKSVAVEAPVSACIEIVFEKASIRLHGTVDVRQLRLVIDCLART